MSEEKKPDPKKESTETPPKSVNKLWTGKPKTTTSVLKADPCGHATKG